MSKSIKDLVTKLGGDEKFTKRLKNDTTFNHVKDNVPMIEDANMMSDLLHLPTSSDGYKYLFVIVDLATDEFDMEPIKTLNSESALAALKKCVKRKHVKLPKFSLKTDGGAEFKGEFQKFLYDNNILHKGIVAGRHQSMSNVESLNRQLSRLLNLFMNAKEVQTGKTYRDWPNALTTIRTDLNAYRKKKLPSNPNSYEYPQPIDYVKDTDDKSSKSKEEYKKINPKFKVGAYVYRYLDHPRDALGKRQKTEQKREGDLLWDSKPRKITQIFTMGGDGPLYRYYLEGVRDASYTDKQLRKAPNP